MQTPDLASQLNTSLSILHDERLVIPEIFVEIVHLGVFLFNGRLGEAKTGFRLKHHFRFPKTHPSITVFEIGKGCDMKIFSVIYHHPRHHAIVKRPNDADHLWGMLMETNCLRGSYNLARCCVLSALHHKLYITTVPLYPRVFR